MGASTLVLFSVYLMPGYDQNNNLWNNDEGNR